MITAATRLCTKAVVIPDDIGVVFKVRLRLGIDRLIFTERWFAMTLKKRWMAIAFATVAVSAGLASSASADVFDFESTPGGFYSPSLTVSNGGLNLTVTTEGFPNGFVDVDGSGVPLLGSQSVIGSQTNPLQGGQFAPLRFTFSGPVDAITFAFGDAGGDDDSPVIINAFDGSSNLLGTLTGTYPAGDASGATLSGNFPGAVYFIASSGSTIGNENSIFWEIPSVTPLRSVPEPASIALLGGGMLLLVGYGRHRRRANA
jgi:PEP-CTERM motif